MTITIKVDKVNSSEFRHPVSIEQRTDTTDEVGGKITAWAEFIDLTWAKVSPLSGLRQEFAGQPRHTTTHRVLMRYLPGIVGKMRVVYEGRYLEIESVLDLEERHIYLLLNCKEGVGT